MAEGCVIDEEILKVEGLDMLIDERLKVITNK